MTGRPPPGGLFHFTYSSPLRQAKGRRALEFLDFKTRRQARAIQKMTGFEDLKRARRFFFKTMPTARISAGAGPLNHLKNHTF
ncbi:hypothetical protein CHH27_01735 [Labrenzia sp. VG12]|nr:hypothetical protein CHH27_01735 [Labrenzia sp. VG12]